MARLSPPRWREDRSRFLTRPRRRHAAPADPAKRKAPVARGLERGFLGVEDNSTAASVTGGCVDLVAITLCAGCVPSNGSVRTRTEAGNKDQPSLIQVNDPEKDQSHAGLVGLATHLCCLNHLGQKSFSENQEMQMLSIGRADEEHGVGS